jgi:hypothetical protein
MLSKPLQVKAVNHYSIWVKFEDNTEGEVDLSHLIDKPVFKNWMKPGFFDRVYIDPETDAIAWDENIELCPNNMYLKIKGITFERWKNNQFSYATNK